MEGTHRVRTSNPRYIAVSYLDLWSFNPQTMSLLGYPKVIPYTKFEHFGIILF